MSPSPAAMRAFDSSVRVWELSHIAFMTWVVVTAAPAPPVIGSGTVTMGIS
ncbi:hypothetical protein D3C86_1733360 [compost metagenome]